MSMESLMTGRIMQFRYWCQKVLPAVYDDSLSYYELLCKVVAKLNEVIAQSNEQSDAIEELQKMMMQLNDEFEKFKSSGFDDYYAAKVEGWIKKNLDYIFKILVRQVYFGLTLDGHFVAYIPESWNDIVFDTGMVYNEDTYGRLILRWDADSPYAVDQTHEIVR